MTTFTIIYHHYKCNTSLGSHSTIVRMHDPPFLLLLSCAPSLTTTITIIIPSPSPVPHHHRGPPTHPQISWRSPFPSPPPPSPLSPPPSVRSQNNTLAYQAGRAGCMAGCLATGENGTSCLQKFHALLPDCLLHVHKITLLPGEGIRRRVSAASFPSQWW